jgi:RarD protein
MKKTYSLADYAPLIISMCIFGTIGIFRKYIDLPSTFISLSRAVTGTVFLVILVALTGKRIDLVSIKRNLKWLILSSAAMGFNWIFLFEAYNFTTVTTATLCYYLAPVFVILASPILFKEALTPRKILCVAAALLGMVFVSGILETSFSGSSEFLGVLCGIGAATLYASVVLMNKMLTDIDGFDRTVVQLAAAALSLLPYVLITERNTVIEWAPLNIGLLLIMGIIHTGFAYTMYFGSIKDLPAQTSALFSYIDPVSAIILSALFLGERMTLFSAIGAVLVLGSTLLSELPLKSKAK